MKQNDIFFVAIKDYVFRNSPELTKILFSDKGLERDFRKFDYLPEKNKILLKLAISIWDNKNCDSLLGLCSNIEERDLLNVIDARIFLKHKIDQQSVSADEMRDMI